jgi:[ribosomal protein S18]-alanine N-acetyltransferase
MTLTKAAIRLASPADAGAIARLSRDAIEHGLPWRWTPPRVARAIGDADTNVIVVRRNGLLAGFGIMSYGDDHAHLLLLAVQPRQRRVGLGSALLHWLEKTALHAGAARIGLEVRQDNAAGLAFYARHGYAIREEVPGMYCGMLDGVRLDKKIAATP